MGDPGGVDEQREAAGDEAVRRRHAQQARLDAQERHRYMSASAERRREKQMLQQELEQAARWASRPGGGWACSASALTGRQPVAPRSHTTRRPRPR